MTQVEKYLALALIVLTAFAAPALAKMTSEDSENYVVNGEGMSGLAKTTIRQSKRITIDGGATLTMVDKAEVIGQNAVISGDGTLKGFKVNDLYGISRVENITIDAAQTDGRATNMQLAAATKEQNDGSVELTMTDVKADPDISGNKTYLKVAPQFVKDNTTQRTTTIASAKITINDSTVGHSLFGGPLAIGNGTQPHNLTIENSTIEINGDSRIGRAVYAGGGVWGKQETAATTHVGNATVIVNGGTIGTPGTLLEDKPTENGYIYGGGLVEDQDTDDNTSTSTVGKATIIINGGTVNGVRGGGRYEISKGAIPEGGVADTVKVENVDIVIDGATVGDGGVKVGGESVGTGTTQQTVAGSVTGSASITLQNITAEQAEDFGEISGEGAAEKADVALDLHNVKGTLQSVAEVDSVGVDPNTNVTLAKLNNTDNTLPQLMLVGDWRDESGVREINLGDLVEVEGKSLAQAFADDGMPDFDPEETGITELEYNVDTGVATATVERPAQQHSGGGGGCSAGFGALALLAAVPLLRMRKK